MPTQQPSVALDGLLSQLRLPTLQPFRCELMEGWGLGDLRSLNRFVWPPQPALHVRQDMAQLCLGPLAIPAFLSGAERNIAPLAIGAESNRPGPSFLWLDHLPCCFARHPYLSRWKRPALPWLSNRKQLHPTPCPLRLARPLTRAGGRVSRRYPANLPQYPCRNLGIEAKPRLGPVAELHRAQLDGVGVDPRPLDSEAPGQLRRIDQLTLLQAPAFEDLNHLAGDLLHCLGVELDPSR